MSFALKPRKFYLSPFTIQKLGGPRAAEVMKELVDNKLPQGEIQTKLSMDEAEYLAITQTTAFKKELNAQLLLRRNDEKFRAANRAAKGTKIPAVPASDLPDAPKTLPAIQLAKGQTPAEYSLKRINEVTPQAVERLVWLMTNGRQEQVQYNAAVKLLGLNGIVEVEKSISVIADAEAIIRELNKRGPYKKPNPEDIIDIPVDEITIIDEPSKATGDERLTPGDSGASASSCPVSSDA